MGNKETSENKEDDDKIKNIGFKEIKISNTLKNKTHELYTKEISIIIETLTKRIDSIPKAICNCIIYYSHGENVDEKIDLMIYPEPRQKGRFHIPPKYSISIAGYLNSKIYYNYY